MVSSYDMIFITDASEDKSKKVLAMVGKLLTDKGAAGIEEIPWGKKQLAYKINKQSEGFYFLYKFSMEGKEVNRVGEKLRMTEGLIRHLLIKSDRRAKKEEPKKAKKKTTRKE